MGLAAIWDTHTPSKFQWVNAEKRYKEQGTKLQDIKSQHDVQQTHAVDTARILPQTSTLIRKPPLDPIRAEGNYSLLMKDLRENWLAQRERTHTWTHNKQSYTEAAGT